MPRKSANTEPCIFPVLMSVGLHIGIVLLTLISWPTFSTPEPIAPHIQARILDKDMLRQLMKPVEPVSAPALKSPSEKVLPEPKPDPKPKPDKEKIEQQRQAEKQKEKLRKKQEAEAQRKQQEAIALKNKKREEEQKKRLEMEKKKKELAEELAKKLAQKQAKEKIEQEKRLTEEKKRREDEIKKAEEQRLAEIKRLELENRLKEEREKARLEKIQKEELALQQQAAQFERALLAKVEAEESAKRRQRELTEIEKFTIQIKFAVEQAWILPPGDNSGLKATLNLRLAPSGDLIEAKITKSSGNSAYDISLKSAAYNVARYPVTKDSRLFDREFRNMYLNFSTE
jgi:colicin import membrane protein